MALRRSRREAITYDCARNLPETTLHATSPRHTTQPSTVLLTCAVVRERAVLHGVMNDPRIDGKDGVAGSIPAGGSTTNQQARPRPATNLPCGQEPATAFAREFASPNGPLWAGMRRLSRPLQGVPGAS